MSDRMPPSPPPLAPRSRIALLVGPKVMTGIGAAAFVAGLFASPAGVWPNYVLAVFGLTCTGLAGAVFTAFYHVTGARWGGRVLPVAHAMLSILPFTGLATLALAFGASTLYPWADGAAVAADDVLSMRAAWMTLPLALSRSVLFHVLWIALGFLLVQRSRRAIAFDDAASRSAAARAGVWFLVAFAPTFSLFTFDWVLSLEKHFTSTIFGIYHFSGLFLSGVSLVTLLAVSLKRRGVLPAGPGWEDTLHDLGKLVFAFAFFWGYIWFSQYMLIWYTNMPEETSHFVLQDSGGWQPLAAANVLLNFGLPFVLLMSRHAKRSETVLVRVCSAVLVGRWLDLYLSVAPPSLGAEPSFGFWEVGLGLGAAGAFLWSFRRAIARAPVPAPVEASGA